MCWNSGYSAETTSPDPGMRISQSVLTADNRGNQVFKFHYQQDRQAIRAQNAPPPAPADVGTFGLQIAPPSVGMLQLRTGRS